MAEQLACLRLLGLCLLLVSLPGIPGTSGSQLSCLYNPSNPVPLGTVNSTLTCDHSADTSSNEVLTTLDISVKRPNSSLTPIFTVTFLATPVFGFKDNAIANDYKNRMDVVPTNSRTTMTTSEILCKDEVEFSATLVYNQNNNARSITYDVSVTVQAPALPARELTVTPTGPVTEHTPMTFTCVANVGVRPRGTIRWEVYENNTPLDVTSQSRIASRVPGASASCTEVQTSVLSLNLTRAHNDAVVRCVVERVGQQPPSFFNQTARLDVLYGVLDSDVVVSAQPAQPSFVVGSTLTLSCLATGNPPPSFTWTREASNWTQAGPEITLVNVRLEDAGRYVCEASNNVSGALHTASNAYQLRVTEVPPTTTPAPSSSTSDPVTGDGGSTAPTTQPASADIGLIVGLVVGALALIAIIVIMVICCRKRRSKKEIEEPSEKPYNNRQNINSISAQPDLVNDKQYNPYKNDDLGPYIDDKPRSRRPVDFGSSTYDQTYMPQV